MQIQPRTWVMSSITIAISAASMVRSDRLRRRFSRDVAKP